MTRPLKQLTAAILALMSLTKAILTEKLLKSFEVKHDPGIDGAWAEEVEKRNLEIKNGSVQLIDG